MSTQHTPSPWYAILDEDGSYDIGTTSSRQTATILCSRYAWKECEDEMHANARLIAAAPDLLVAAQEAMRLLELLAILAQDGKEIYKHELRGDVERFTSRIAPAIEKATGCAA